jgi:hypothetical protein
MKYYLTKTGAPLVGNVVEAMLEKDSVEVIVVLFFLMVVANGFLFLTFSVISFQTVSLFSFQYESLFA